MAAKKLAPKATNKPLSKSAVLEAVVEGVGEGISRKHVKAVVESLAEIGHRELKKNGVFILPGFAKFAAKPASKGVKARPIKALKDAVA